MTAILFLAQRASAAVLAFFVTVHLATILYAVRGGLTAGEVLARTRDNLDRAQRANDAIVGSALRYRINV